MRIFYLCYEDLNEHRGGSVHVTQIVKNLALLGHDVDLFVPTAPPPVFSETGWPFMWCVRPTCGL